MDSKEEYINRYYDKLKSNNYNTIIINLRDMDKSEGWNPLEYPYNLYKNGDKDKAQEYLEKIGKIIFHEDSSQDPFWTLTASDFFTGVTLALFEDGSANEVNLNSVNNMFNEVDKKIGASDYITEYFKSKGVASKPYIFASTTFLAPKDTKESILSVARQKLRLHVSREKLSQLMNKTTFNFEDIAKKPSAIILTSRDENNSLNSILAMFIEQLYAVLVDLKVKNRFNLILDNFDNIEKCNDLVDILGSCISRNIKTYIATRSLLELTNIYGSYMPKLCDLLSIGNDDIRLVINNVEQKIDKDFKTVTIQNGNIEYPKLSITDIKLFDLEKFVKDIKIQQLENIDFDSTNLGELFDVDALIKSIDEKIAQIEMKEKIENNKEKEEIKLKANKSKIMDI